MRCLEPRAENRPASVEEVREGLSSDGLLVRIYMGGLLFEHRMLEPCFGNQVEIEKIFVDRELQPVANHLNLPRQSLTRILECDLPTHRGNAHRWLIRGEPGSGKTTLLRQLVLRLACREQLRRVPLFASLPDLAGGSKSVFQQIEDRMGRVGARPGIAKALGKLGRDGRLLLLLDGLDEVPPGDLPNIRDLLIGLAGQWPRMPIVVASRGPVDPHSHPGGDFLDLDLLPLDGARQRALFAAWFGRRDEPLPEHAAAWHRALASDPRRRSVLANPLCLSLWARQIELRRTEWSAEDLPLTTATVEAELSKRTEVGRKILEFLIDGTHRRRPNPLGPSAIVRQIVAFLGHMLIERAGSSAMPSELEGFLEISEIQRLRRQLHPPWQMNSRGFLGELADRIGLLGPAAGGSLWDPLLREVAAAMHLAEIHQRDGEAAVCKHAASIVGRESAWAEAYALMVEQVGQADALLLAIGRANQKLAYTALTTTYGISDGVLFDLLGLDRDLYRRRKVFEQFSLLIDDPARALTLLDRVRHRTRDGNDLYFIDLALTAIAERHGEHAERVQYLRREMFSHIPKPDAALFRNITTPQDGSVNLWRGIPAGNFEMGSTDPSLPRCEKPPRRVNIPQSFRIGVAPITVAQYAAFDPNHRLAEQDPSQLNRPVVEVTWIAARMFCRWLGQACAWTQNARLPREEEWEYVCRAMSTTKYSSGDLRADLDRVGWHEGNSENRIHSVGEKPANPWGLYDLHGNVLEWTESVWTDDLSQISADAPMGAQDERVIRGGSFRAPAGKARSTFRHYLRSDRIAADVGFRVLLPQTDKT